MWIGAWCLTAALILGCGGGDGASDAAVVVDAAPDVDVYVAGYEIRETQRVATVWRDGVATHLVDALGSDWTSAEAVVVSRGEVHIAGYGMPIGGGAVATVWKDAVATTLSDRQGAAEVGVIRQPQVPPAADQTAFIGLMLPLTLPPDLPARQYSPSLIHSVPARSTCATAALIMRSRRAEPSSKAARSSSSAL